MEFFKQEKDNKDKKTEAKQEQYEQYEQYEPGYTPLIHKQMSPSELRKLMQSQEGCSNKSFAIRESSSKGKITVDTFLDHIAPGGQKIPGVASYRFVFTKERGWVNEDPTKPYSISDIVMLTKNSPAVYVTQLLDLIEKSIGLPKSNLILPSTENATKDSVLGLMSYCPKESLQPQNLESCSPG